jgi:hypothetical protein
LGSYHLAFVLFFLATRCVRDGGDFIHQLGFGCGGFGGCHGRLSRRILDDSRSFIQRRPEIILSLGERFCLTPRWRRQPQPFSSFNRDMKFDAHGCIAELAAGGCGSLGSLAP